MDLVCIAEKEGRKKPTMIFGNPGPVWNILPQYLSSELRKKMEKRGVDIQDRSYVRYVADVNRLYTRKLELHTAKTYDLVETKRTLLDLAIGKSISYRLFWIYFQCLICLCLQSRLIRLEQKEPPQFRQQKFPIK